MFKLDHLAEDLLRGFGLKISNNVDPDAKKSPRVKRDPKRPTLTPNPVLAGWFLDGFYMVVETG